MLKRLMLLVLVSWFVLPAVEDIVFVSDWGTKERICVMNDHGGNVRILTDAPRSDATIFHLPLFEGGFTCDWAVFEGRLYAAADEGVGRWNETTQMWEYPMDGLPIGSSWDPNDPPWVWSFTVRGGHLFAGLETHGVYIFDADAEHWSPAGLEGFSVHSLLSHADALYAGTDENGIYRLEIPDVLTTTAIQLQGKALTTWAGMKQPLD